MNLRIHFLTTRRGYWKKTWLAWLPGGNHRIAESVSSDAAFPAFKERGA